MINSHFPAVLFVVVVLTVSMLAQCIYDDYYVARTRPTGMPEAGGMGCYE